MGPNGRPIDSAFVELVAARVRDRVRLDAVASTGLLDTEAEPAFDRVARLAARLLRTPFAFVTLVDDRRSFWKACIGVDPAGDATRQSTVEESFCQYVIGLDGPFLIDDARLDTRTKDNPSIESMGVIAWAGVPLRAAGGEVLGTVCVVDTKVHAWQGSDAELLEELAQIVADVIDSRTHIAEAERSGALLEAILARAPIGFSLLNAELRFEMINDAMAAINGHPSAAHFGHTIRDMLPEVADDIEPLYRQVLHTGEALVDVEIVGETAARPGSERIWTASYFPISTTARTVGVGTIVADITDRVRSRQRAERLAQLTRRLGAAETEDAVVEIVLHRAAQYLGSDGAVLGLFDRATGRLQMVSAPGAVTGLEPFSFHVDDLTDYGMSLRDRETVVVADRAQRQRDFPESLPLADSAGVVASATVPLLATDGRVLGVLAAGWRRALPAGEFPVPQLEVLADVVTQSLERARAETDRRTLISSLQHTLLSPAPTIAGIDLAVRYSPAASSIGFGGDWYDIVTIGEHRCALVVGDVVGHDAAAAARMSHVRTVVSTLLELGTDLGELFPVAEGVLANHDTTMLASVAVVAVDTAERTLTCVLAGHPPPLIATPDGTVAKVPHSLRPWLGVGGAHRIAPPVTYEPGSTLVCYTDGLVETRSGDIESDIALLGSLVLASAGRRADDVADSLLTRFADTDQQDDIALIVAGLDGAS